MGSSDDGVDCDVGDERGRLESEAGICLAEGLAEGSKKGFPNEERVFLGCVFWREREEICSSRLSRDEIVGGSGRDGMGLPNQDGRKLSRLEKRNSEIGSSSGKSNSDR